MVHGNICPTSVFVTKAGDWKLGGFDLLFPVSEPAPEYARANADLLPAQYRSPELSARNWSVIESGDAWSIDAWSLGCLIFSIFNGSFLKQQQLGTPGSIPKSLIKAYGQLLLTAMRGRLNPKAALAAPYFQNDLIDGVEFLANLPLKSDPEKSLFFSQFNERIAKWPPACLKYKVLPELTKALEFGAALSSFPVVLEAVLRIGAELSAPQYAASVVPAVVKLFSNNSRAVRITLLQNLELLVPRLSDTLINESVWVHISSGFTDASAPLREATLKSAVLLAPKLNAKIVDTQLMQFLAKLQTDKEPGIRTNTTYCLGKIASFLSAETQKKVLVSAFTRALRDPFPPARTAGLACLMHSVDRFSPEDCAQRVLPAAAPFAVDPVKAVREAALKCITACMATLRKLSDAAGDGPIVAPSTDDSKPAATAAPANDATYVSATFSYLKRSVLGAEGGAAVPAQAPATGAAPAAASANIGDLDRSKFMKKPAEPVAATPLPAPAQQQPPSDSWADVSDFSGKANARSAASTTASAATSVQSGAKARPDKERKGSGAVKPVVAVALVEDEAPNAAGDWDSWDFGAPAVPASNSVDDWGDIMGTAAPAPKPAARPAPSRVETTPVKAPQAADDDPWGLAAPAALPDKKPPTPMATPLGKAAATTATIKDDPWASPTKAASKPALKPPPTVAAPKAATAGAKSAQPKDDWADFLNS